MTSWVWLDVDAVQAIHLIQLDEFGGLEGMRSPGGLDSALSRPRNQSIYGEADAASLAAAYAYGIARNHPFADGNKRMAWLTANLFLAMNDVSIAFDEEEAIEAMLSLAAGDLSEADMADWIRTRIIGGSQTPHQ